MANKNNKEIVIKNGIQIFTPEVFIVGECEYEISFFSLVKIGSRKESKQIHGVGTGKTIIEALRALADNLESEDIVLDLDLETEEEE